MQQLVYQRSFHSSKFQAQFGLFLWATGCARQTIEALHVCGLSVSYTSVLGLISTLAKHCKDLAVRASKKIHMFCYDNMNLSTSIFTEQRGTGGPAKVTSGTFGIIYKLRNALPEHMELAPIMDRLRKAKGLDYADDLRMTKEQRTAVKFQLSVIIIRALLTHVEGFSTPIYIKDPRLQHQPRRAIPAGYKTQQFPLRVTTIEEASLEGNLLYHDEVYLNMLNRSSASLSKYAIPSSNDQLTNSRIRSAFGSRSKDTNAWNRREVFQLGLGLFHLCLNLIWALLLIHRGSLNQLGSLTYFFKLLDKTRLGSDHPDYHSLLSAIMQILNGLLINAWRQECDHSNLAEFAKSTPTADKLLELSKKIYSKYCCPYKVRMDPPSVIAAEDGLPPPATAQSDPSTVTPENRDTVYENVRLLTRDLLYVAELIRAISDGDIGRIEDFLPELAKMFRGAGSNNYCSEILHFIFNLKHVWTPEFACVIFFF